MSWEAITAIATVVLAIGVPLALYFEWKSTNRSLRVEREAQYVTRYQEIFSHLPYNIFVKGNQLSNVAEETKVWLVSYIDLCNEELFDYRRNSIGKEVWKDWSEYMVEDFKRSAPLREVFNEVKDDYGQLGDSLNKSKALS